MLLSDVASETDWRDTPPLDQLQSWLGGSIGRRRPSSWHFLARCKLTRVFTTEHLRLAKSLAVPAAVAIQNARLHERAEIYAAELELRLQQLQVTQEALEHAKSKSSQS